MFCEGVLNARIPRCKPTDTQTSQRTLRATQVIYALARAYTVILQNRLLRHLVWAHNFINDVFNKTYLNGVHYRLLAVHC
jgi:hypothetical protein